MVPHRIRRERLVGLEAQRHAGRPQAAVVGVVAGEGVRAEPVAAQIGAGGPQREHFAQRRIHHAAQLDRVMIAVLGAHIARHHAELRLGGDQIHHAARRVAAIQRALRPAQHLHPLDVEELGLEQVIRGQRRVVDVYAGRRIPRCGHQLRADSANREVRPGEIALREIDVGNGQHQIGAAVDLLLLQLILAERGNRDGHRLQALGPPLRSDDHLFFAAGPGFACRGGGRGFLGFLSYRGRTERRGDKQARTDSQSPAQPRRSLSRHGSSPLVRMA